MTIRRSQHCASGVLTQTAKVHGGAWKEMFDGYLRENSRQTPPSVTLAFRHTGSLLPDRIGEARLLTSSMSGRPGIV